MDEEEEELQRKLEEYEAALHRAEVLRQTKLDESVEKAHRNNMLIHYKQEAKQQKIK